MNLKEFQDNIVKPINLVNSSHATNQYVLTAYRDVLTLATLAEKIEKNIYGLNIVKLAHNGEKARVNSLRFQQNCIISLLKSLYVFSDVYIRIFMKEALLAKRKIDITVLFRRLEKQPFAIPQDLLLNIYCLMKYRNKIVVHHDHRRGTSYGYQGNNAQFRFIPHGPDFFCVPDTVCNNIEILYQKYKKKIPGLDGEMNPSDRARILFYGIPLSLGRNDNPDRSAIDHIIEKIGCESMTAKRILECIDGFSLKVAGTIG